MHVINIDDEIIPGVVDGVVKQLKIIKETYNKKMYEEFRQTVQPRQYDGKEWTPVLYIRLSKLKHVQVNLYDNEINPATRIMLGLTSGYLTLEVSKLDAGEEYESVSQHYQNLTEDIKGRSLSL